MALGLLSFTLVQYIYLLLLQERSVQDRFPICALVFAFVTDSIIPWHLFMVRSEARY